MRVVVCDKVEKIESLFFAPPDADEKTKRDAGECLKAVRLVVLFASANGATAQFSERLKAAAAQRGIRLVLFTEVEV